MLDLLGEVGGGFNAYEAVCRTEQTDAPGYSVIPSLEILKSLEDKFGALLLLGTSKKHNDDNHVSNQVDKHA